MIEHMFGHCQVSRQLPRIPTVVTTDFSATFLKSGTYALSRIVAGQSTIGLAVRAAEPVFLHRI